MRRAFFMKDLSANDTLVAKRYYDDETGGLDGDYGLPEDYFNVRRRQIMVPPG